MTHADSSAGHDPFIDPALFESGFIAFQSLDANGRITAVNQSWLDALGYQREEVLGKSFADFLAPAEAAQFSDCFAEFLQSGVVHAAERTLIRKDGTPLFSLFEGRIARTPDGRPRQTVCLFIDVTESHKAVGTVRDGEERLRKIIEDTNAGYFRLDQSGRYVNVNRAWLRMHGFSSEEEITGRHYSVVQAPADLERSNQVVSALDRGESATGEFTRLRNDGSIGYHTYSANPIRQNGAIVGIEGFLIDTTATHLAEEARRVTEHRAAALWASMAEGAALHSLVRSDQGVPVNYRIIDVNQSFERIVGMGREQVVGRLVTEAYGVGDPPYLDQFAQSVDSGQPRSFEVYFAPVRKHFAISVAPTGPNEFATIFFDISRRKHASEELAIALATARRHEREISALLSAARSMLLPQPFEAITQAVLDECCRATGAAHARLAFPADAVPAHARPLLEQSLQNSCTVARSTGGAESEALLLAPIVAEGGVVGALLLDGKPGGFADHDERTSRAFAEFLALTLRDRNVRAERDAAANAVKASDERLREMLEKVHLAAVLLDLEGRVTFCNDFLLELTGWRRDQVLGGNYFDRFSSPADRDQSKASFDAFVRGAESTLYLESEILARSGETRNVAWYCTTLREHTGAVVGMAAIGKDTTARLRAEAALRSSEARFRHVVENSPEAIMIQTDGRFAYVNPAAVGLFGASSEAELLGCSVLDRFHPETHDSIRRRMRTLHEQRVPVAPEIQRVVRPGGTVVDAEVSAAPFEYDGKHGALVFLRDVTERRKARELEEQLVQAQRLESIGKLAGGIAHDFNNLLTVINGYSDVALRRLSGSDPLRASISEIRKAGEKAALLTQQLLAFSRRQLVHPVNLDLNDAISDMEMMIRRTIGEHINVVIDLDPHVEAVKVDPGQVTQVLMNLVVNARDAMRAGGTLAIETRTVHLPDADAQPLPDIAPGPYIRLGVRDTGDGIPPEILPRIFEPFFTTKGPGEGTGLGLSMVYGIVKQAGGHVRVASSAGGGTSFSLYFPAVGAAAAPGPVVQDFSDLHGSETILLVEDQDEVRKLTRDVLRGLGYQVLAFATPDNALAAAIRERQHFDLLITDMVMPGMSGQELVKALTAERAGLKWLFISGYNEAMGLDRALLAGDSFLPKPFTPDQLARRVRQVLGQRRRAPVVLLTDEEPAVRQFLTAILIEGGYEVVDSLPIGKRVDIVVVDVTAAGARENLDQIRAARPGAPVIALCAGFTGDLTSLAIRLGVRECLAKPVNPGELLAAVNRAIELR